MTSFSKLSKFVRQHLSEREEPPDRFFRIAELHLNPRVAFSGEVERRERMMANLRQARLSGIRVRMPATVMSAKLAGLPEGVTVAPGPCDGPVLSLESGVAGHRLIS